jgi:3-oxoacyl-[acyl-carrier protein] reductase
MDLGLAGRVAIVSGGSRGIGKATATELAAEGCAVVLAARNADDLAAAAEAIGGDVAWVSTDMTTDEGVQRAVATAHEHFGPVSIAVSNVIGHVIDAAKEGDGPQAGYLSTTPAFDFAREHQNLLVSAWLLARHTLPDMRARRWGRIVNIGSGAAREPALHIPHVLPNTVRPAVAGLYRLLADRVIADGITVNSVLTGAILTERGESYWRWLAGERGTTMDAVLAEEMARFPLGRIGTVQEMSAVVAFLCSRWADRITGQSIPVMGGGTKHL